MIGGVVRFAINLMFVIGLAMEAESVAIAMITSQSLSAAFIVPIALQSQEPFLIVFTMHGQVRLASHLFAGIKNI